MKLLFKIFVAVSIASITGMIIFIAMINITFGVFDKKYNHDELKKHYENNVTEFDELIDYFNSIIPANKNVEIEFENKDHLFRFGVQNLNPKSGAKLYPMYLEWDLNIHKDIPDTIISQLNWDTDTFRQLKNQLENADCIQIENGNPTIIGFKRSGFGMYSYYIFTNVLTKERKETIEQNKAINFISNKVAWKYDGGALD